MRWFQDRSTWFTAVLLVSLLCPSLFAADPPGQADLDAATSLKLAASSMADLERVIELTESAIEKGLDEQNEPLAKSLLTATLFQHGSRFAQALLDPRQRTERPAMLKQFALKDFYKILEYDESLPRVYMMIARLEAINVNPRQQQEAKQKGIEAAEKAIELLDDDNAMQSKALLIRAGYEDVNSEKRIEILDRAVEVDPTNLDALRLRGKSRLFIGEMLAAAGKLDEAKETRSQAVADFMKLLEENPDDADALQSGAELLGRLGEFDKAMEFANQVIEQNPGVFTVYLLRARLQHKQENYDAAIADLDKAVDIKPTNFLAYLDRSEVYLDKGDAKAAAKDYEQARELKGPTLPATIIQRTLLRAQNNQEKALDEIKKFLELDERSAETSGREPDPDYRLQLSVTYVAQSKPIETIDILTPLIDLRRDRTYSGNTRDRNIMFMAVRSRANSYLSIGKHQEAIQDYQKAESIIPSGSNYLGERASLLNNLAWVLATSPEDKLRNAKEAVRFATEACELTQYKAAHILSTLAAAHAESGDFDTAKKYSSQAVDLAEAATGEQQDEEMLTQLRKELASYEKKEPWRELQNVLEEKQNEEDSGDPETAVDATEEEETDDQPQDDRDESDSSTEEPSVQKSSAQEPAGVE